MQGREILNDPLENRGTAFSNEERDRLGLRGLLPPAVESLDEQVNRVHENCRTKSSNLEKYIFLMALLDQNETLFYRAILDRLREYMPLIYTPTVGEAATEYAQIFRRPRGLYVTADDTGRMADVLRNWPRPDVRVIVATDGERILGLGDLGANGMSIPVGKLSLYTAAGGIPPTQTLPIFLDIGTDNEVLRSDPLYLGMSQKRLQGDAYLEFMDEFVAAVGEVFPHALIQFEDFASRNAYPLLDRYRERVCTFNDDIQGTAAVGLAGIHAALRITGEELVDQKIVFLGGGSAGTGIAGLFVQALIQAGLSSEEAHRRCWFVNRKGLVVSTRDDLLSSLRPYAHAHEPLPDLLSVVNAICPTVLVGATGSPGTFTPDVLRAMAGINTRPIIFALSNPTSRAECTAEEAYGNTEGRAIFASGSPFDPVVHGSQTLVPGQANNVYVFPGIGLGVVACGITRVSDAMFLAAAKSLADSVSRESLDAGTLFPPLESIRDVSVKIGMAAARVAEDEGNLRQSLPAQVEACLTRFLYPATYT